MSPPVMKGRPRIAPKGPREKVRGRFLHALPLIITAWLQIWLTHGAEAGCLSRIQDLIFLHPGYWNPDPRSRVDKIPDPGSGSASRNLSINKQKTVTKFSKIVSRMFILDSGYRIWIFSHTYRCQKSTGSWILDTDPQNSE